MGSKTDDSFGSPVLNPTNRARAVVDYARAQVERTLIGSSHKPTGQGDRPTIRGYALIHEIHRGGQGVVYKARQVSTGREVAVKVLHCGAQANPVEVARFEREIKLLARLRHPNIVALLDGGISEGSRYLVMDFVDGEPLDRFVRSGSLGLREVLGMMAKICEAVGAAHHRGIVHRDLKPSNVRIDGKGEPHVLDFGLAKLIDDVDEPDKFSSQITMTGQFVGSLPWAAPEQVDNRSHDVDMRTDVYALGVILYVLITGRHPYPLVGNVRSAFEHIVSTPPTPPSRFVPNLDRDVETIILKCLTKDTARRYQSGDELAREIRRCLSGQPIEARRDSTWYVLSKTMRRHRAATLGIFAGIAFLFLYAGTATYLFRKAQHAELRAEHSAQETRTILGGAQGVMSFVVSEVSVNLGRLGGTGKVRENILRETLNRLDELTAGRADDPELQPYVASLHYEKGDISFWLRDIEQAERHFQNSLDLRRKLSAVDPGNSKLREQLSLSLIRMGDMAKERADWASVEEYYRESIEIDLDLVRRFPSDLHLRDNLFWSHFRLGECYQSLGQFGVSDMHYEEAFALASELVEAEPDNPNRVHAAANAAYLQATRAFQKGDCQTYERGIDLAIGWGRRLIEIDSDNPVYLRNLPTYLSGGAVVNQSRGDYSAAVVLSAEAVQIHARLASESPWDVQYADYLLLSKVSQAWRMRYAGEVEECLRLVEQVLPELERRFEADVNDARAVEHLVDAAMCHLTANETLNRAEASDEIVAAALAYGIPASQSRDAVPQFRLQVAQLLKRGMPENTKANEWACSMIEELAANNSARPHDLLAHLECCCEAGEMEAARWAFEEADRRLVFCDRPLRNSVESTWEQCASLRRR